MSFSFVCFIVRERYDLIVIIDIIEINKRKYYNQFISTKGQLYLILVQDIILSDPSKCPNCLNSEKVY